MNYREDIKLPAELPERVSKDGFDILPELIQVIIHTAMWAEPFPGAPGETLQRMDDPDASYSITFQDIQQLRRLWERLPTLTKNWTGISTLFVDKEGSVILL